MEMGNIASPSPSNRKSRRMISDDGDYIAFKKENCIQDIATKSLCNLF